MSSNAITPEKPTKRDVTGDKVFEVGAHAFKLWMRDQIDWFIKMNGYDVDSTTVELAKLAAKGTDRNTDVFQKAHINYECAQAVAGAFAKVEDRLKGGYDNLKSFEEFVGNPENKEKYGFIRCMTSDGSVI